MLKQFHAGATMRATAYDRTGTTKLATGTLGTIDNQIDTTTGTVKLRAKFDNSDERLFPNQFVNIKLLVDTLHNTVLVPTAAIQRGAPGTFVYLVKPDNTVAVQTVTLGPGDGERVAVLSGLQAGDEVVDDGADRLKDGAKITVAPPAGSAAAAQSAAAAGDGRRGHRRRRARPGSGRATSRHPVFRRIAGIGEAAPDPPANEPVAPLYPAPGGDVAADGGDHAGRHVRLPLSAAVGAARGRLPDDPGADLLSRRQPGRDDLVGHRAARSAVRPDAGPQPDVVDEFGRRLGHHAAIQPRPEPRRRRAGGPGGDQRRRQPAAVRPAGAADLRQGQPGRRADPDPGADLEDAAADAGRGPRRHAPGAEDLAACRASASSASAAASARRCASRPTPQLAAYGLNIDDLRTTIGNANVNTPKGNFDGPSRSYTINANDQIQKAEPIRRPRRSPTRTARRCSCPMWRRRRRPPKTPSSPPGSNTTPAIIVNIQRQPGANVIAVVDSIKALLPELRRRCRPAVDVAVLTDRTTTIRASVADVEFELGLAVVLVVVGDLRVPAQPVGDADPEPVGAAVAGRHARRHVSGRVQPQQPVADGADDRDRLRRRRRDRDDREHLALHRGRRAAAAGGAQGLGADRLHHHLADRSR